MNTVESLIETLDSKVGDSELKKEILRHVVIALSEHYAMGFRDAETAFTGVKRRG